MLLGFVIVDFAFLSLTKVSSAVNLNRRDRPWLDISLPTDERLELLMLQFNQSKIYAQVQGDTVVSTLQFLNIPRLISHSSRTKVLGSALVLAT